MKEYVIHVTKTTKELNGKWLVLFTTETIDTYFITLCTILHGPSIQPYAGCSMKHPKDEPNDYRGMHDSFKRAVEALVNDKFPYPGWASELITDPEPNHIESRFRGALWIAMGRPGDTRPMILEPMLPKIREMRNQAKKAVKSLTITT